MNTYNINICKPQLEWIINNDVTNLKKFRFYKEQTKNKKGNTVACINYLYYYNFVG